MFCSQALQLGSRSTRLHRLTDSRRRPPIASSPHEFPAHPVAQNRLISDEKSKERQRKIRFTWRGIFHKMRARKAAAGRPGRAKKGVRDIGSQDAVQSPSPHIRKRHHKRATQRLCVCFTCTLCLQPAALQARFGAYHRQHRFLTEKAARSLACRITSPDRSDHSVGITGAG